MTISDSPPARAVAQRLLARGMPEHGTPDAMAAGAEYVFVHVFHTLSQWIGTTGCHTLFARALALSAPHHPVLMGVRYQPQGAAHFDHLAQNAREYGSQATAEGATAILATIITILAGLIGEDLAMNLLEEIPTGPLEMTAAPAPDTTPGLTPRTGHGEATS